MAGSAYCTTDGGPCQLRSMDWNTGTVFSFSLVSSRLTSSCLHFEIYPTYSEARHSICNNVAFTENCTLLNLVPCFFLLSFQGDSVPSLLILRAPSSLRSLVSSSLLFSWSSGNAQSAVLLLSFSLSSAQLFSATQLFCWWGTGRAGLELTISVLLPLFSTTQAEFFSPLLSCGFFSVFHTPYMFATSSSVASASCLNTAHLKGYWEICDFNWALVLTKEFKQHQQVSGTAGKAFK